MELGLDGKVALVTGSGRGIGADTALAFAQEGCRVVVSDIDPETAAATAARLVADGHEAVSIPCDVTDEASAAHLVEAAEAAFGAVDVLVNNAGYLKDGYLAKMSLPAWDSVIDIILKGTFLCSRAVLPGMMARKGGRIVNISSRSIFGNPGQANYSAAKAGLIGFTRALSQEAGKFGITVNAVAPGFIMTEGIQSLPHFEKLREAAVAKNPVGFLGEPRDVSDTVLFLASARARYITGTTVFVTGGRYSS